MRLIAVVLVLILIAGSFTASSEPFYSAVPESRQSTWVSQSDAGIGAADELFRSHGDLARTQVELAQSAPVRAGSTEIKYRKFSNEILCEYPGTAAARATSEKIMAALDPIDNTAFAVRDYETGVTCAASYDVPFFSASTIKVATIAALLWQHENNDTKPDDHLLQLARLSIVVSDNDAQQVIWDAVGAAPAMQEFFTAAGMSDTKPVDYWGLTLTTAKDYLILIDHLVNRTLLGAENSDFLLDLMAEVDPEQAWGVSGGTPSDATVRLKNGWLYLFEGQIAGQPVPPAPAESPEGYPVTWTINSGGYIESATTSYAMVVMTDLNPDYDSGSQLATQISTSLTAALHD